MYLGATTLIVDIKVTDSLSDGIGDKTILIMDDRFIKLKEAKHNLFEYWDTLDLGMSPKESKGYVPFTWANQGTRIAKYVRNLQEDEGEFTLYIYSKDVTVRAMALALAISESSVFKGQFTEELLKQCQPELDNNVLVEYLGLKSDLYKAAKNTYKERAKELTRYELLGELTNIGIYDFVFGQNPRHLDWTNLI